MHPRTRFLATLLAAAGAALCGCQGTGDVSVLGYTTAPPFDPNIRSVYVPTFKNVAFHTSPYRGIEVDLTQAVVDELGRRRSPIRVVSDPSRANTELIGTIKRIDKQVWNRNLSNLTREFDTLIFVDVLWRDLRDGRVLSGSRAPNPDAQPVPFDPSLTQPAKPVADQTPVPVTLIGSARGLPELGESNTTVAQQAIRNLAVQIVNMMEQPW